MSSPVAIPYIEPWMSGSHTNVPAVGRAVLHALELALDDLTKWTAGLTDAEVHARPLGLPSVAFHLKHIARSVDRILSYAEGGQLSAEQLTALKAEQTGDENLAALLAETEGFIFECRGAGAGAGYGGFRDLSRYWAQAVAGQPRRGADSCSGSYAAACGAGGDDGEGAGGVAVDCF